MQVRFECLSYLCLSEGQLVSFLEPAIGLVSDLNGIISQVHGSVADFLILQ